MLHPYVLGGNVVHRWMARLQHAFGPHSVGDGYAPEDHLDLPVHVLEPRRARVIPHGFLTGTRLYSLVTHKTSSSVLPQDYMDEEAYLVCAVSRRPRRRSESGTTRRYLPRGLR